MSSSVAPFPTVVMAGLVPAIHVLLQRRKKDVDGRHEAGHDVERADATRQSIKRRRWMRGSSPRMTRRELATRARGHCGTVMKHKP